MSRYGVEFTTAAAREVRKLDAGIRRRVLAAIDQLGDEPRPAGARKLVGYDNAWRVRISDSRVMYEVHDDVVLVTVFRVGHRRDVYEG